MKFLLVSFVIFQSVCADSFSKIENYSDTLEKYLLLDASHLKNVISKITLNRPSTSQEILMADLDAQAIYNDEYNTIVLKDHYYVGTDTNFQIISPDDLEKKDKHKYIFLASTIFHELSHADFDLAIEKKSKYFTMLQQKKITPWFVENYPDINPNSASQELFGYIAGEGIIQIHAKIEEIMLRHGIKYPSMECMSRSVLEKISKEMGFLSNLEFQMVRQNKEYYKIVVPTSIYVKGREINLESSNFPEEYKKELYDYFIETYRFPSDQEELIQNLNGNFLFYSTLQSCYEKILR